MAPRAGWWVSMALWGVSCATGRAPTPEMTEASPEDQAFQAPALNPDRGESIPKVRYAASPDDNWSLAERAFEQKRWLAAQQYYAFIRAKFPYTHFAADADLRIADCQFEREHYIEAIDSYQNFVRLHPTHEQVPYATFRTGLAHVEQIPGSWFLIPPAHEKDQTAIQDAARALAEYLRRYPNDSNVEKAKEVYEDVRARLVQHERAVADFYRRIGKPKSYAVRLEVIRRKFGDVGLTPKLLLEIARVGVQLGDVEKTRGAFAEMEAKFPDAEQLREREALVSAAQVQAQSQAEEARKAAKEEAIEPTEDT